jgi:hypothetical protein
MGNEQRVISSSQLAEAQMSVPERQAASMYARACRAWYGRRAPHVIKDTIKQLRAANDVSGVRMWTLVAEELPRVRTALSLGKGPAFFE